MFFNVHFGELRRPFEAESVWNALEEFLVIFGIIMYRVEKHTDTNLKTD